MKTAQKRQAKPCLSARYTYPESDSYACNSVASNGDRSATVGSGIGFGSPTWSRSTVWFKRPDDVAMPRHNSLPVRNLQAIAQPSRAPIAPSESVCMSGKFAGIVTPDKKGKRAEGETAGDIASNVERKLAKYRKRKAKPTPAELAEIAELRAMKDEAKAIEIAAKLERQSTIRHSLPSRADRDAEIERNEARNAFEQALLERKVANAEEAAQDPVLWAEVERELELEMAGR